MKRIFAILAVMLCLVACTREKQAPAEENCTKYQLVSIGMGNMIMSAQEAKETSGIQDLYFKLYDDGTAKLRIEKDPIVLVYAEGQLWTPEDPETKIPCQIQEDTVIITDGAFVYEFKK